MQQLLGDGDAVVDGGGALIGPQARELELHPQRRQALAEIVVQLAGEPAALVLLGLADPAGECRDGLRLDTHAFEQGIDPSRLASR